MVAWVAEAGALVSYEEQRELVSKALSREETVSGAHIGSLLEIVWITVCS